MKARGVAPGGRQGGVALPTVGQPAPMEEGRAGVEDLEGAGGGARGEAGRCGVADGGAAGADGHGEELVGADEGGVDLAVPEVVDVLVLVVEEADLGRATGWG